MARKQVLSWPWFLLGSAVARALVMGAALPSVTACVGDSLWNQEIVATVGPSSDIVVCAPKALGAVAQVSVDRRRILFQYGIVQIDMTVGANVVVHGDVRRTGSTSATIAFYGRQVEEPIALKSEIAARLASLRAAVQDGCSM